MSNTTLFNKLRVNELTSGPAGALTTKGNNGKLGAIASGVETINITFMLASGATVHNATQTFGQLLPNFYSTIESLNTPAAIGAADKGKVEFRIDSGAAGAGAITKVGGQTTDNFISTGGPDAGVTNATFVAGTFGNGLPIGNLNNWVAAKSELPKITTNTTTTTGMVTCKVTLMYGANSTLV
jgi:hypothetical protein